MAQVGSVPEGLGQGIWERNVGPFIDSIVDFSTAAHSLASSAGWWFDDSAYSMPNLRSLFGVICGLVLALVLTWAGPYPIGGDPDLMYKPIKSELARSLAVGQLPFWSTHFGIGVPLVAESHVAAFYPPNWLLYRIFDVHSAYPLAMWLHWFALGVTTYAYARTLGIGQPGSMLAAVSFSLCGFQAVHIVHEPFYYLMPYMPLCLLLAHRYMTSGKFVWLAGLRWPGALSSLSGTFRSRCGQRVWSSCPAFGWC